MVILDKYEYEVIEENRDALDEEALQERYSDILAKYDYIVGDWGYNQLRLKGFYEDKNPKAAFDTKISTVQDYLYEYCNFGCAYFVLKRGKKVPKQVKEAATPKPEEKTVEETPQ